MSENTRNQLALFSILSLVLAGCLLLAALHDSTQVATSKILSIDFRHLVPRALVNFSVVGMAAFTLYITLIQGFSIPSRPIYLVFILFFTILGLVGGLAVRYASWTSWCCESPVAGFFGFPFSWLRGIPPNAMDYEWARLHFTDPLRSNWSQMNWQIQPLGSVANLTFWLNAGLLIFLVPNVLRAKSGLLAQSREERQDASHQ